MIEAVFSVLMLVTIFSIGPLRRAFFSVPEKRVYEPVKRRSELTDVLKGISIIAVIITHVGYIFLLHRGENNNLYVLQLVNNFTRFALPFFFILSGALLYLPSYSPNDLFEFYSKKVVRVFIPYTLCTLAIGTIAGLPMQDIFKLFFSANALTPYYFMVILFQLYILYPLLLLLRQNRTMLIFLFVLSFIGYSIPSLHHIGFVPIALRFLFFFFYGMCIREWIIHSEHNNNPHPWIGMLLIYIFYTLSAVMLDPVGAHFYNEQFLFALPLLHLCLVYRKQLLSGTLVKKILLSFGRHSLWIYLLHYIIVALLYRIGFQMNMPYYIFYIALLTISILLSYVVGVCVGVAYTRLARLFVTSYVAQRSTNNNR